MKKSSKNSSLIAFLIFVTFFTFQFVHAQEITKDYSVFMSGSRYEGAYCSSELTYFDVMKSATGDYYAKLKDGIVDVSPKTESLTCSYVKDTNTGVRNGNVTYTFTFNGTSMSLDKNIITHLYVAYDHTFDVINGSSLLGDVKKINNVTFTEGAEYFDSSCLEGGTICTVTLKDLEASTIVRTAVLEFDYVNSEDKTGHVKVNFKIHSTGTIYANTGSYGTCSAFGSGWSLDSGDTYLYHYEGGTITLPTCNADSSRNPFIKFVGWSNNYDLTNTLDNCNSPIIAGGSAFTPDFSSNTYSTCYVSTGGFILNVGKGSLKDTSEYTYKSGVYYRKEEGPVTLPTPEAPHGLEFVGWRKENVGELIPGGTVVESDGSTYYAVFEKPSDYVEDCIVKTIVVGKTTVYAMSGTSFVSGSCYSSDPSKVTATDTASGACYLTGVAKTEDSEMVTITAKDASGNEYTNKVQVVAPTATTEAELGTNTFTISLPNFQELVGGSDTTGASSTSGLSCTKYTLTRVGWSAPFATQGGNGLGNSGDYRATSQCGDGKQYAALCLDPGKIGPNGQTYVVERSLNPKTNKFDNGAASILSYLTKKGETNETLKNTNNTNRIASNVAARLMAIKYGESSAAENNAIASHYAAYVRLSNNWYNDGNLNVWTWSNTAVRDVVRAMMENEKTYTAEDISEDVTNEAKEGNFESGVLSVTGTITLPEGATVESSNVTIKCPSGASCSFGTKNISGNTIDYVVNATIGDAKINSGTDCSSSDSLCVLVDYKPSAANVPIQSALLLRPAGSSSLQRMIVFAPGTASVSVPIYTKHITKDVCDLPDCVGTEGCVVDEVFFEQLDCCSYITDHTSDIYKTYCGGGCLFSNYNLACAIDASGEGNIRDDYQVYEAANATDGSDKYGTCVVDVQHKIAGGNNKTDEYTDDAGNKYSLDAYKGNKYCRVSCSEDWDFSLAGFKDFTGTRAILAGSYFQINEDVYLKGTRTCVTTYIDYEAYLEDISSEAEKMTTNWNEYSDRSQTYYNMEQPANQNELSPKDWYYYDSEAVAVSDDGDTCGWDLSSSSTVSSCSESNDGSTKVTCSSKTCGTALSPETCYTQNTYSAKTCYKVSTSDSHKYSCKVYEIKSPASSYDYYERSGDKFLKNASTASVLKTTVATNYSTENLDPLNEGTKISDKIAEKDGSYYFSSSPTSGACHTDTDHDGTVDKSSDYYYDELLVNVPYKGKNLASSITSLASEVNNGLSTIQEYANDFYMCQNFYIVNTNDTRGASYQNNTNAHNYTSNLAYQVNQSGRAGLKSLSNSSYKVNNAFSPRMAYEYEELEYMTIIGKDAILTYNKDYNSGKVNDDNEPDVAMDTCVTYTTSDGKAHDVCNNKYTTDSVYVSTSPWSNISTNGKSYSGTEGNYTTQTNSTFELCAVNTSELGRKQGSFDAAACSDATFHYYQANYIKQAVTNSAYFSNKDYWYVNQKTDIKAHAENREKAASKYHDDKANWSKLGTNHNVFPIQVTTRRNIYQYVYSFNDIGVFADGTLGRIMSANEKSLISYNTHACFYEVKEELCLCCGDPINTTTVSDDSHVDTESTVTKVAGVPYTYSNKELVSGEGILGFFNSSISLNDMDSGTGRTLAKNWSDASKYYYGGELYTTDKGAHLVSAIEDKGEKIYDDKPEYSYTLGPSALAELRNSDTEYGINYDKLTAYGVFNIDTNKNNIEKYPVITHYVNKSLTTDFNKWITEEYKSDVLTSISSSSMPSGNQCTVGAGTVGQAKSKVRNCRFVDYIDVNDDGTNYRLAFK